MNTNYVSQYQCLRGPTQSYTTQSFRIRWEGVALSNNFLVTNGVRQGGVLSPALFNVYIDDLSEMLIKTGVGCNLNGTWINHLVYADDTVLLAPSPSALQDLLNSCCDYANRFDIIYNVRKTKCMSCKPKCFKDLTVPNFYLNGTVLKTVSEHKYLGCIIAENFKDDCDISRQMRSLYARGNTIVRNFRYCSAEVKLQLFKSYCSDLYCGQLRSQYKASTYSKLRVVYNGIFRLLMNRNRDSSISQNMLLCNINNLHVLHRKSMHNFRERLYSLENDIVSTIAYSLFFTNSRINRKWLTCLYRF